jgi:hypothetical protein
MYPLVFSRAQETRIGSSQATSRGEKYSAPKNTDVIFKTTVESHRKPSRKSHASRARNDPANDSQPNSFNWQYPNCDSADRSQDRTNSQDE